jgi:hypothetical protein
LAYSFVDSSGIAKTQTVPLSEANKTKKRSVDSNFFYFQQFYVFLISGFFLRGLPALGGAPPPPQPTTRPFGMDTQGGMVRPTQYIGISGMTSMLTV